MCYLNSDKSQFVNTFCANKYSYYVLQNCCVAFVKPYDCNRSDDLGPQILFSRAACWPALIWYLANGKNLPYYYKTG
jgi:hypothetical protein